VSCVITRTFSAFGEGFHCLTLGFHADVTIPPQHPFADMPCQAHDRCTRRPSFRELGNSAVTQIVKAEARQPGFLCQSAPR